MKLLHRIWEVVATAAMGVVSLAFGLLLLGGGLYLAWLALAILGKLSRWAVT